MPTLSRPIYTDPDKRKTLDDLASLVTDGAVVAVGGGLSSREPMALLRAILRRRATGLTVVGSAHGIDIDLLCAGGALSRSSESYVGFEQDFGQAPNYRRAIESGAVKADDSCCYTLVQQLRAAIQGLPFMPMRSVRGTSFPSLHPEYRQMVCPFADNSIAAHTSIYETLKGKLIERGGHVCTPAEKARLQGDCPEPGGQAANAICGCRATAGSNRCPNPEPSVPL